MVLHSVVDDDCDVKMIVECKTFLSCYFVCLVETDWNASVVVWGEFSVFSISHDGCRRQII